MTKLILTDLGKVLLDFDFVIAIKRLQKQNPIDLFKIKKLFSDSGLAEKWDKGTISESKFYDRIQKEMNLSLSMPDFIPIWNEIFTEKKDMIQLMKSLNKRYKVIILSNTNPWHAKYVKETYPWIRDCDDFVASCDVQMLKPDLNIYKFVLSSAGVRAEETFYIDDRLENINGAKKVGMDTALFNGFADLKNTIKKKQLL